MEWKKGMGELVTSGLVAASVLSTTGEAQAVDGRLTTGSVASAAIGGPIDYTVYLPAGYDADSSIRYPSLYLLHGRGDTQAAWQQEIGDIDELTAAGSIPAMIVIMPDAPWSNGGNYYVDSQHTGTADGSTPGVAVETAFTGDLLEHIDASFRTLPDRAARAVGGYSMGGAGALRFATAHQDLFSVGIILSPAVYVPSTPVDSSTRVLGAYGVGTTLYDEDRYQALNYPETLSAFDPAMPVHLFIAVGDDEYANPLPEDAIHDLDYEAATLYNQANRVAGITAELRVYDGGHDWEVWKQGFREGLVDIAAHLRTEERPESDGLQFGSVGGDRAGGVLGRSDGSVIQAINAADAMLGSTGQGGLDVLVQKHDANGAQVWFTPIASAFNERAYGVVDG
ncbi:esterase family protein [Cryobacterium sp. N19]|uniref:alpha/beta hydrolase n=1 Tax=Cryobacterium sp. N19 TaxID=2048288 RepID=UPI001304F4EE|nr:alpha/beta hydrolase-fold protein [Cryobacterium sp. N19]